MDVNSCHTCKNHNGFPRNAAKFDFSIDKVVTSFDANVKVTVHAACSADTPKEEIKHYEDQTAIHLTADQVNEYISMEKYISFAK